MPADHDYAEEKEAHIQALEGTDIAFLKNYGSVTNLSDINRLLHETVARERAIDVELDKQLARRADFERRILMLNATTSEMLELVHADAEQLLTGVQATSKAAERIGGRVRRLDVVQIRMQETLELINLILDRTNCVSGVQAAMAAEDYDQAASYISTFLELETRLSAAAQGMDTGQVEEQRKLLLAAKSQLEQVVADKMRQAIAARDHTAVLRFVGLHKPLGVPEEGLKQYIGYLRLVLGNTGRELYEALSDTLDQGTKGGAAGKATGVDFVSALTQLFKAVAMAVEQDEEVIAGRFGPAAVLDVVVGAQAECDSQGVRLLARYLEAKRVPRLVQEAQGSKGSVAAPPPGAASSGAESRLDPRQLEPLIQELVIVLQHSEEYSSFMLGRMQDRVEAAEAAQQQQQRDSSSGGVPPPTTPTMAALRRHLVECEARFKSGQFSVAVGELVSQYMALEEFYLEETVSMAIRIDQVVPDALTSSMVDDVFFILKKCGGRAVASGSVQCVCALLGQLNDLLCNKYKAALAGRLAGGAARLVAAAPSVLGPGDGGAGGSAAMATAQDHAVAINNVDVSAEYIMKLKQELEGYAERAFGGAGERERIRSVLADLTKTGGDFRALTTKALEAASDSLLPRLKPVLDELGASPYNLGDADYGVGEVEDSWVAHLIAAVSAQLNWMQDLLTPGAWEGLFHALLDKLLARLEVLLGRKAFTQLGGLQLDRDLRALVAALGEMTTRTVRDKFARLNQMAIVLSLESVEEFLDYWGDDTGHITWRLTPAEVRGVLKQRTDFSKDAIASLPL